MMRPSFSIGLFEIVAILLAVLLVIGVLAAALKKDGPEDR